MTVPLTTFRRAVPDLLIFKILVGGASEAVAVVNDFIIRRIRARRTVTVSRLSKTSDLKTPDNLLFIMRETIARL